MISYMAQVYVDRTAAWLVGTHDMQGQASSVSQGYDTCKSRLSTIQHQRMTVKVSCLKQ